jgi:hypothetical protein
MTSEAKTLRQRVWSDSVWSKVIANAIWAGGVFAYGYLAVELLPGVVTVMVAVADWFGRPLAIATWVVVIAVLFFVYVAYRWTRGVIAGAIKDPTPAWLSFKEEVYEGVRWRWNYLPSGSMSDLRPYCARCSFPIRHIVSFAFEIQVRHKCENCGNESPPFTGDVDDLESLVKRRIFHQIQTTYPS